MERATIGGREDVRDALLVRVSRVARSPVVHAVVGHVVVVVVARRRRRRCRRRRSSLSSSLSSSSSLEVEEEVKVAVEEKAAPVEAVDAAQARFGLVTRRCPPSASARA